MKPYPIASILAIVVLMASNLLAQDVAPALSLSKAAKLAEDAITSAALPEDCFLRSISLVQNPDSAPYYRAGYKPPVRRRSIVGAEAADAAPVVIDVLHIAMDGKVSFEQETPIRNRSIINRSVIQPK